MVVDRRPSSAYRPDMDRRGFLLTWLVGALAAPLAAEAQESTTHTRVAFLGAESPSTNQHFLDAFR